MHRARPCPVTYQRVSLTVLQKREEKKNFEVVSIMIVLAQAHSSLTVTCLQQLQLVETNDIKRVT